MKKIIRVIAVLMMAAMLTASMLAVTSCGDASDKAEKAKESLVRIANVGGTEKYGVGFFIGKGKKAEYVVTTEGFGDDIYALYDGTEDKVDSNKLTIVKRFPQEKIALYKLLVPTTKRKVLKITDNKKLKNLDNIIILSFKDKGSSTAQSRLEDMVIGGKGGINDAKAFVPNLSSETDFIQIGGIELDNTNIGGPLLNENGVAIGVLLQKEDGKSYASSLNALISELKKSSIPFIGAGLEWYWIVLIVIGCLIVLGGAAVAVLYFTKWKKPAVVEDDDDDEPKVDLAPNATPSNFTITGVSGYFADNNFTVTDKITIGRDVQRCNIIYPPMTAGISSVHCEITRVGNHMEIVDKGSSCGTFLTNGVKLNTNVPYVLTPGEIFYLGSQENQFLVG